MESSSSFTRPIRVAYVSQFGEDDRTSWSGIPFRFREALEAAPGIELTKVMGLRASPPARAEALAKKVFYNFVLRRHYRRDRSSSVLRSIARAAEARLAGLEVDAVVSPGTLPLACLETDKPVAFLSDSTFLGLCDYYPDFSNLCAETRTGGTVQDNRVLGSCALAAYSSRWAGESAVREHGLDASKLAIIPLGANEASGLSREEVEASIRDRQARDAFRILFNGVDWERKGGPAVLETVRLLRAKGLDAHLDIVGCRPPIPNGDGIHIHGYISRQEASGRERLHAIFRRSHFLLLPSRAECFGIVFAEAGSFGIPAISTMTGGIPDAVIDGETGYLAGPGAGPEDYADIIAGCIADRPGYAALALGAYDRYSRSLNWEAVGLRFAEALREKLAKSFSAGKTKGSHGAQAPRNAAVATGDSRA